MKRSVWIGFDPREAAAYAVARESILRHTGESVRGVVLSALRRHGLYQRETERRGGQLWDVISDAPMSTEFAISRFLVPMLAGSGWALFVDGDVLVRGSLNALFDSLDPDMALYCVQHRFEPTADIKMDGQIQTRYARKNWSSVMVFNCDHPANGGLNYSLINRAPGRDLHRFCWLDDSLIGALEPRWNFLVGHTDIKDVPNPSIVHFTGGTPDMAGYEDCAFADEWRAELARWAA